MNLVPLPVSIVKANLLGEVVGKKEFNLEKDGLETYVPMDVSSNQLRSGVYIVSLKSENLNLNEKLIVKHE